MVEMEHGTEAVTRLVFQLAIILIAAKLGGEVFERFFKLPSVLGELGAGILIGPFALGGIDLPAVGSLFEHVAEGEGFVRSTPIRRKTPQAPVTTELEATPADPEWNPSWIVIVAMNLIVWALTMWWIRRRNSSKAPRT